MKRLTLPAALAFAFAATVAFAQQAPAPATSTDTQQTPAPIVRKHMGKGHSPEGETARMTRELNLTPDQSAKIEPILADRDQKVAAIRSNTALAPADAQMQVKAIHKSTEQQLSGVLTPDQLQQMKAAHKGDHHGKGATEPLTPPSTTPQT